MNKFFKVEKSVEVNETMTYKFNGQKGNYEIRNYPEDNSFSVRLDRHLCQFEFEGVEFEEVLDYLKKFDNEPHLEVYEYNRFDYNEDGRLAPLRELFVSDLKQANLLISYVYPIEDLNEQIETMIEWLDSPKKTHITKRSIFYVTNSSRHKITVEKYKREK